MDFLNEKASELTVGKLLLVVFLGAAGAYVFVSLLKHMTTTKELVVTGKGRTFVKTSFFGPASDKAFDEYRASKEKAIESANQSGTDKK